MSNFGICLFTLLFPGCGIGGISEAQTFESLLVLVERGESILERELLEWKPAMEDFLECLNFANGAWTCEDERSELEIVFDQTLRAYEFQRLIGELNTLRLSENSDASNARDAFVKHLRAWRRQISLLLASMPSSAQLVSNDFTFRNAWVTIISSNEISETFDETCSGLGNAQPIRSDEFSARILNICDD